MYGGSTIIQLYVFSVLAYMAIAGPCSSNQLFDLVHYDGKKSFTVKPNVTVFNNVPGLKVTVNNTGCQINHSDCNLTEGIKECNISVEEGNPFVAIVPRHIRNTEDMIWTKKGIPYLIILAIENGTITHQHCKIGYEDRTYAMLIDDILFISYNAINNTDDGQYVLKGTVDGPEEVFYEFDINVLVTNTSDSALIYDAVPCRGVSTKPYWMVIFLSVVFIWICII